RTAPALCSACVVAVVTTLRVGIFSPAGVQNAAVISAPDDHFAAGPHCPVKCSAARRADGAGGCPTIGAGIISPAGIQIAAAINSAPDDHFASGPHCRVLNSASRRVGRAGGCPPVAAGTVCA